MQITEAQRQALLDRAIEAVRDWIAVTPDTDPDQVDRLIEVAQLAVTDAVTRGGHVHTLISSRAGVPGLLVIPLITDWDARGEALGRERNAAKSYEKLVREACASYARQRIGAQGSRARGVIARQIGVTGPAVDAWVDQD